MWFNAVGILIEIIITIIKTSRTVYFTSKFVNV